MHTVLGTLLQNQKMIKVVVKGQKDRTLYIVYAHIRFFKDNVTDYVPMQNRDALRVSFSTRVCTNRRRHFPSRDPWLLSASPF